MFYFFWKVYYKYLLFIKLQYKKGKGNCEKTVKKKKKDQTKQICIYVYEKDQSQNCNKKIVWNNLKIHLGFF